MMKFGERKVTKEKFNATGKPIKILNVNLGGIVISKLIETKANSNYLIGYLNKAIKSLALIMPKMSGCLKTFKRHKTFKVKDEDKDINKKLMSFHINDEKLLEDC